MINDRAERSYYFAVKNLLELNSSEWLGEVKKLKQLTIITAFKML